MSSKEALTLARQMNSTTSTTKTQSWILPTGSKFNQKEKQNSSRPLLSPWMLPALAKPLVLTSPSTTMTRLPRQKHFGQSENSQAMQSPTLTRDQHDNQQDMNLIQNLPTLSIKLQASQVPA